MVINQLCTIEAVLTTTCFFLLILHKSAYADPVLIADDANVSDKHACHIESSATFYKHSGRYANLSPICGLTQNLEMSLGINDTVQNNDRNHAVSVQLKRNLKPVTPNGWGAAASLTVNRNIHGSDRSAWTFNIPITYSLLNDHLSLNTNVSYKHQADNEYVLGAISSSYSFTEKATFSVEVFNQDHHSAFYQTAVGYELIKNILQVEASYADRFKHHQDRWIGLGLSYSPTFN